MKRARQRPSLPSLPLLDPNAHNTLREKQTNKENKQNRWVVLPRIGRRTPFFKPVRSFLLHGMAWHGEGKGGPSVLTYHIIHRCIHTYNSEVCLFALPNERPEILPPPACLLACRFVMNGIITHPADPAMSVSLNARTLSVYLA